MNSKAACSKFLAKELMVLITCEAVALATFKSLSYGIDSKTQDSLGTDVGKFKAIERVIGSLAQMG